MNEEDALEHQLKALARSEIKSVKRRHRIRRALEAARRQTAAREGLGFVTALIWVLFAGLGTRLITATRARPAANEKSRKPRPHTTGGHA